MPLPPSLVYMPEGVRTIDRLAIETHGIPGYTLMERAGTAAFALGRTRWPGARRWLIVCGAGNNAGDGYVVARLARRAGLDVTVAALSDPHRLSGDAGRAWRDFQQERGEVVQFTADLPGEAGLIVDAMLGTGIRRPLEGVYLRAVEAINESRRPVLAVDIPTGLDGASGETLGACVGASATITFVGLKQGFFLASGPDWVGELSLDELGIPGPVAAGVPPTLRLVGPSDVSRVLPPRRRTDHKGRFGHVLLIGGNEGMYGAIRLAGAAALRAGAGLVTVATRPANAALLPAGQPELMCHGVAAAADLEPLLERATVVAIGPGLGRDAWARELLGRVLREHRPRVLDADALNLLPADLAPQDNWILTPHPGEAGRLLGTSATRVQGDRLAALSALGTRWGGTIVLKGCCTLIGRSGELPLVVDRGNPGMATAGTGDVLTGLMAGLVAQTGRTDPATAAAAVFVHGAAGDGAAAAGQRGILAGDLLDHCRPWLNPAD